MPADVGPPSLTSPVRRLASGRLLLSVESNKNYRDASRWFQRVVYLYSSDEGRTWTPPVTVCQDPTGRIRNWDQRVNVAPDGRLASFTWTYDSETVTYRDIHRRISTDEGLTWTEPEPLGITDQAGHPAILPDGRVVLPWVDHFETHSLRVRSAAAIDAPLDPASEVVLYSTAAAIAGEGTDGGDALLAMATWTFGSPFALPLHDGSVLVAAYVGETGAAVGVNWYRLDPNG